MYDCIIVGAGVIGLMTALELRAAGVTVALVERGRVGGESSWAGGGILSPLYPWRYAPAVNRLAAWGRRRYAALTAELLAETGIDPEYDSGGLVMMDAGEELAALAWARESAEPVEAVTSAALLARAPAVRPFAGEALLFPEVARVRNPRLVRALHAAALARGIAVLDVVEVTALRVVGGRFVAAETPSGPIPGGSCVLAAGAWSAGLLSPLPPAVAVAPVKGEMVLFRGPPGLLSAVVLEAGRYVIPRRDGRVLVGSTLVHAGFDCLPTPAARQELVEAGRRIAPALGEVPIEAHWAGLRPGAPAGIPYIAKHPAVTGLFLNAGHYRNGLVMAPAAARLCADLVLGRPPVLDPAPYAWDALRPDSGWD